MKETSFIGNAFDVAAATYDCDFSESVVGRLQRNRVHHFLQKSIRNRSQKILEINCGTGEDALWLAPQGNKVIATDASEKMIEESKRKISEHHLESAIEAHQASFSELKERFSSESFDLIFSDFGGLNCVSPPDLSQLAADFSSLLKPGGKFIAVIMGRKCLWERFYFLVKGKPNEAFRRNARRQVAVKIGDGEIPVWYHTPAEFRKLFKDKFVFTRVRPVGLFIPPSYLNCFFADWKFLLRVFNTLEKVFPFSFLSDFADHYFIELQKKD